MSILPPLPRTPTSHKRTIVQLMICAVFLACAQLASQAGATSTFGKNLDGWGANTTGEISWSSTGGNPGGHIRFVDKHGVGTWVKAPTKFLGNWSALNGRGVLRFDHRVFSSSKSNRCLQGPYWVVIRSGSAVASWNGQTGSGRNWNAVAVPIVGKQWKVTGAWTALLQNVTSLEIQIEVVDNGKCGEGGEVCGLDNVQLILPCGGGTGQSNQTGATVLANKTGSPGAGPFTVTVVPQGTLTLDWTGPSNQPFVMFWSAKTCSRSLSLCGGIVDLDPAGIFIMLQHPLFVLDKAGKAQQVFSIPNFTSGQHLFSLQGLVLQPKPAACNFRLTAAFNIKT